MYQLIMCLVVFVGLVPVTAIESADADVPAPHHERSAVPVLAPKSATDADGTDLDPDPARGTAENTHTSNYTECFFSLAHERNLTFQSLISFCTNLV